MLGLRTKMGKGGRLIIPATYRHALHLEVGEDIILHMEKGELRLRSLKQAIHCAQETVKKANANGDSLTETLFQLRQEETPHE